MKKFIILGSGRRVQQDVVPSLIHLGVSKDLISIYARRKKKILVRLTEYEVRDLAKLKSIENGSIVYIAVSREAVESVLEFITELNPNLKIIVDTPIGSQLLVKKFCKFDFRVAEDAFYLGKYLAKSTLVKKKFNFLVLHKSAMSYHGIAFIESLLSKIVLQFSFYNLYLGISKKGISIIYGRKNYEKGKIFWNLLPIKFPVLSKSEEALIGGRSDYDSISYRFLDLKRLGLVVLLRDCLNDSNQYLSLQDGYNHFKKGKLVLRKPLSKVLRKIKNAFRKSI